MGAGSESLPSRPGTGWPRPTVFRWLLALAIVAIGLHPMTDRIRGRRDRLREVADNHARLARNYRDGGNTIMVAWHELMSREQRDAAERPWQSAPTSRMIPPPGWSPPE